MAAPTRSALRDDIRDVLLVECVLEEGPTPSYAAAANVHAER